MGYSVTEWIKSEGFPNWDWNYSKEEIYSLEELNPMAKESIRPQRMGVAVDYITRLVISNDFSESFMTVSRAFGMLLTIERPGFMERRLIRSVREKYLEIFNRFRDEKINWRDTVFSSDGFVEVAVRFTAFDTYYRTGRAIAFPDRIRVSQKTIENIRILVGRICNFLRSRGGEVHCGADITALTTKIDKGDWDFLTPHELIDIKTSKHSPAEKKNWIQLLVYYLLAKESGDRRFQNVRALTLFNPRQNTVYTLRMGDIPREIIDHIKGKWGRVTRRFSREEIEAVSKFHRI